ncbi:MAG: ribosome biogenesis GTPase Der [Acidobacteria bacterium]|nr:ribosome biogenesis GTPase Der [Acidobacteriota bacterium]
MPLPRIAIVGLANVGKSTLFNRLYGRRHSLVADHPGLTRDLIEVRALLGGTDVILVDTGGIMPDGSTPLAGAVRAQVLSAIGDCALLLFVVDSKRGWNPHDEELSRVFRESGRPILLVVNKVDSHEGGTAVAEFSRLGYDSPVAISAEHGLGMAELHAAAAERMTPSEKAPAEPPEIRIAIAGRPNVGKSSLLNALLKKERAIVSDIPGTTHDPVDALLEHRGHAYRLIDTAGLRQRGKVEHGSEALSVAAARRAVGRSDVTLVLVDATTGIVAQDLHVLGMVAGGERGRVRPLVVLLNKIDLLKGKAEVDQRAEQVRERLKFAPFAPIIPISALRRLHLDRILQAAAEVHEEGSRFVATTALNNWLHEATEAHRPPVTKGKPLTFVFVTQTAARPPQFAILTNRPVPPHFSYARYLENSLRKKFAFRVTPIVVTFRGRERTGRPVR